MSKATTSHPNEAAVRHLYDAINRGDRAAVAASFTDDAVWHGGEAAITGAEAIAELIDALMVASNGTLHIELHDVLANDAHVVALQVTHANRAGRSLADRVVYVYHVRGGRIAEAWFGGDPRVQDAFWA